MNKARKSNEGEAKVVELCRLPENQKRYRCEERDSEAVKQQ